MVHCAGCQSPILDRYLFNVLDRPWHGRCLQCNECQINLSEKCFFKEGKLFCRTDFFKRYGTKCAGCGLGISPTDLVRRARSKVFHLKCLICMICRKQLCTGEELYILDDSQFVCKDDYLNLRPTIETHYPLNASLMVTSKEPSDLSSYKRCSTTCNENINVNLDIPEAYGGADKTYCPYSLPTVPIIRPTLLEPGALTSHNFSIPALGQQNEDVFNTLARKPRAPRARRPRGSCSSTGAFSFLSPTNTVPSSPGRKLSTSTRGNSPLTISDQGSNAKRAGNKKKSPCNTNNSLPHPHNFSETSGVTFNMAAEITTPKPEDERGPSSCGTEGGVAGCEDGEEDLNSLYYYEEGGGDEGDEDIEEECDIEDEDGEEGLDETVGDDCCDEDDGGSSRSFAPPTALSSGSPSCGQMTMDPSAFYKGMLIASVGDANNEILPGSGCYGRSGIPCGGPGSVVSNGNNGNNSNNNKRRGPRTTIKAKQLETLKSAFAATPKPTRHIREQLARETGLNMRVIQVWFQNRRSKERRMKQLSALGARRHFFRHSRRIRTVMRPEFSPLREGEDNSNKINNSTQLLNPNNGNAINHEACNYNNEFHNFFPSSDANNFSRPFVALDHNGPVSPSMMLSHLNPPKDMGNADAQRISEQLDSNYLDQLTAVNKSFYPFNEHTPPQNFKGASADSNNNHYGHYQQLDRLQDTCPPALSLMLGTRDSNNAKSFECEINDMKPLQRDSNRFDSKQLFPYRSQGLSNFDHSTHTLCLPTNFSQQQQFRGQQDPMKNSLSEELMTNNDFNNDTNEILTM